MGWIIFVIWMIIGIAINICIVIEKSSEDKLKERTKKTGMLFMWIGVTGIIIAVLYGLCWAWYYFCCGFLVFEDPSPGWKIIWGLTSLIPLGLIVGLIAIFSGWDPFKK
ncbi:hypothetical protein [Bacteroides uniformis]|uniref:Transmembrane protein n=1 Tax=Bacteroides uniformis TaxID=820 RepID=A0A6I0LNE5_BACUN|nr:hypothetical protein [Bacteroides uniformis]KAB4246650.1 hypothetical protein GAP49_18340 [Bacteroides uniformis]KAB4248389.1 hypothetical protein GAP48_18745 [Bacteroides uniformis]KAB4252357.1 hypothetical protein GAO04_09705 [Bacteroides uniformis]KAB4261307.1 hypothetical protein GAP40_08995 [Bacteroides uniformis]